MYIVTGGAGFIGSAIVWKLNAMGINDILVVDNLASTEKWKNLVNRSYTSYMHRDEFLDAVKERRLQGNIEAIFHMGACSSTTERDADFLMKNNLEYSKTLCLFALEKNARFICASSAATYGDGNLGFDDIKEDIEKFTPLNMYGYSKQLFDVWAKKQGLLNQIASLKFFNVYGPNEYHKADMRSVINKAFYQIGASKKMSLFRSNSPDYPDGGQKRDFVYVKDCVDIIWWLYKNLSVNGVFNVGTSTSRTWNDLVTAVFTAMKLPVQIDYIDMPEHLKGKYQNFTEANISKLRQAGYAAPMTPLENGVSDYICHYLATPDPYL